MPTAEQIADLSVKAELLAPAGRWDVLESVIAAGADAVYLSGKQFNMRHHRGDFHFNNEQLADAVRLVHDAGRRLYVTVNALLGEAELPEAQQLLTDLDALDVDAVIVQDLATLKLAQELDLGCDLHASTMMNVHHVSQARVLKSLGVSRVITSRDISLDQIGAIGREAGIEVECFVHGDMCVAQSGQCTMSGVLFGKSANRGECMKPCRWDYDLVRLDEDQSLGTISQGHLLSINDLCLIRHIPDVIEAGVCSLKIEGRMRDKAYLGPLVACYREAIDTYYQCPPAFSVTVPVIEGVYREQVRRLSTLTMLGGASHADMIDTSGRREPMFLSNGAVEPTLDEQVDALDEIDEPHAAAPVSPQLAVCVSDAAGAEAAMEGGADRIDLAAEVSQAGRQPWTATDLQHLIDRAHEHGVRVGVRTSRVTTARHWRETRWLLEQLRPYQPDCILAHHLGTLELARTVCPDARVIADFGFNVLNSAAIELLDRLGADRVAVSNEAGLAELRALDEHASLPLEIFAHGPIEGMLIDHCLIALHASASGRMDVCRGPCRHVTFGLRDRHGQVRPIIADQHCRNHLLTGHDVAIWPHASRFLLSNVAALRVSAQFDSPAHVGRVTQAYRCRLDALAAGQHYGVSNESLWRELCQHSPRPLNLGPYARSIVHTRNTAAVMRELAPA